MPTTPTPPRLPFFPFPGNALGGSLANFGGADIAGSQFRGNLALAGSRGQGAFAAIGGGGAILNDASLTVADSSFFDNRAVGGDDSVSPSHNGHALGGAIMSGSLTALLGAAGADLTVSRSDFRHNQALGGHDNRVTDAAVSPSDAPDNAYGGALLIYQGTAAIRSSTLTLNRAVGGAGGGVDGKGSLGVGGGIFFYNFVGGVTATVADSRITGNAAIGGAGATGSPAAMDWAAASRSAASALPTRGRVRSPSATPPSPAIAPGAEPVARGPTAETDWAEGCSTMVARR